MKNKNSFVYVALAFLLAFTFACSKKIPASLGNLGETYSCIGVLPVNNETSFSPMGELLSGYLNLEFYSRGFDEILASNDFERVYREEGQVYFPKRFNRPLALEYSALLGLDGVIYGNLSSPDRMGSDAQGKAKPLNLELYFVDVKSSKVVWSYNYRTFINPGQYNSDLRAISKSIVEELKGSGFKYLREGNPCWDTTLAQKLRRLPSITKETFNYLSYELAESGEENLMLNLGNIFMTVGRRDLALVQYKRFLSQNPASPFRGEVERQVAVIQRSGL